MSEIRWERTGGKTWTVTVTTDEPVSPLMAWAMQAQNAPLGIIGVRNVFSAMNVAPTPGTLNGLVLGIRL